MNNITTSILLLTAVLASCSAYAASPIAIGYGIASETKDITFTVANPSDVDARGHEVPYQITHDGKLIFRVSIPASTD